MSNQEPNWGDKRHELTKEDMAKGGRTVTKRKLLINGLNCRKYCNESCPLYNDCWAKPLSFTEKYTKGTKHLCALKGFSSDKQKRTIELFLNGEIGIQTIMKDLMIRILNNVSMTDSKEMRAALRDLKLLNDTFYGQKQRNEVKGEFSLVDQFIRAVKESSEEEDEQLTEGELSEKTNSEDRG